MEIGQNYKVAIVEYPGYRFSDDTNTLRANLRNLNI